MNYGQCDSIVANRASICLEVCEPTPCNTPIEYVTLRVLVVSLQKRKQPGAHVDILDHCQRLWVWNHMARRRPGWHKLFKVVNPGSSSMLRQRLPDVNIVIGG